MTNTLRHQPALTLLDGPHFKASLDVKAHMDQYGLVGEQRVEFCSVLRSLAFGHDIWVLPGSFFLDPHFLSALIQTGLVSYDPDRKRLSYGVRAQRLHYPTGERMTYPLIGRDVQLGKPDFVRVGYGVRVQMPRRDHVLNDTRVYAFLTPAGVPRIRVLRTPFHLVPPQRGRPLRLMYDPGEVDAAVAWVTMRNWLRCIPG